VVLYHPNPGFSLKRGESTSLFPSIWNKGAAVNPAIDINSTNYDKTADPNSYMTGGSAPNSAAYYNQTGLTIVADFTGDDDISAAGRNNQWEVFVFADKDPMWAAPVPASGGYVEDPQYAGLKWIAWSDAVNDSDANIGVPPAQWKVTGSMEANIPKTWSTFNTVPLTNLKFDTVANETALVAFLLGTDPTGKAPVKPVWVKNATSTPGLVLANPDRICTLNDFSIADNQRYPGLVYVSPNDPLPTINSPQRTQYLHMQFMLTFPKVIDYSAQDSNLYIYMRTNP
jgi:hypothetical protein